MDATVSVLLCFGASARTVGAQHGYYLPGLLESDVVAGIINLASDDDIGWSAQSALYCAAQIRRAITGVVLIQ